MIAKLFIFITGYYWNKNFWLCIRYSYNFWKKNNTTFGKTAYYTEPCNILSVL